MHLILLTGVAIFTFPFIWLVATSFKTDDEVTSTDWMPSVPTFRAASPYILPEPELTMPLEVKPATWDRLLPKLIDETQRTVREQLAKKSDAVDPQQQVKSVGAVLVNRLTARLSTKTWDGDDSSILAAYRALLTPDAVADAMANRLARLELRGLQLRSLDAHSYRICGPTEFAKDWKVVSGPAEIKSASDGATYLNYHFASSSDPPIVLRYEFEMPFDPDQLHKLSFGVMNDNSWHMLSATLDAGKDRWVSSRAQPVAQNRPANFLFQPPTYEDQTTKPHIWTLLDRQANPSPNSDPRHATLTVTITPSSTMGAILAKIWRNYDRCIRAVPFWKYVRNSFVLVVLTTVGTLFSSTFVAYSFARLRWPGRSVAMVLMLSTMMLPAQVTMIPSFMIWRTVGWYNTLNPLWVPSFFGVAFFVFLMVQHMKTIPRELEEAARIDGLNAVQTWWYIIVPLVKPAAAAIAIMTVLGAWNDFLGPLIYLRDQTRFPLSLGLFGIRADVAQTDWTMIMAGNVLMILPVILMFIIFQKYFVQGMAMSGMKG
jgi:ABC-type glycerol-3-phosphate transport system permease component